jgi:integrase
MTKRKRRGQGEGSIYYREDEKRWVASFMGEDGKRIYRSGKTRREAFEKLQQALQEQKQGKLVTGPQQTVRQYLEYWLDAVCKPPALRISSYEKYRKLINTYILPALGHIQLQKLTPQHVQALYRKTGDDGLSSKMINSIHGVLHKALGNAVRWNLVSRNICDLVSPPRIVKPTIEPLTMEQAHKLLEAVRGHRLEVLLIVALTTGIRRGELLALRWSEVDLEGQRIQVRRTVDYITHYGYVETEPKTAAGKRMIALPYFVADMLKQHRHQQLEAKLKVGRAWEDRDLVFTDLHGGYFNPRYLGKLFDKILVEADLPHMRFHDLRHSAATLLLSMGVHVKVVQEILGHSNISMTADTYSHVLPSMQEDAMGKWDDEFGV